MRPFYITVTFVTLCTPAFHLAHADPMLPHQWTALEEISLAFAKHPDAYRHAWNKLLQSSPEPAYADMFINRYFSGDNRRYRVSRTAVESFIARVGLQPFWKYVATYINDEGKADELKTALDNYAQITAASHPHASNYDALDEYHERGIPGLLAALNIAAGRAWYGPGKWTEQLIKSRPERTLLSYPFVERDRQATATTPRWKPPRTLSAYVLRLADELDAMANHPVDPPSLYENHQTGNKCAAMPAAQQFLKQTAAFFRENHKSIAKEIRREHRAARKSR